ncbi:hypothetical protein M3Y99_00416900 [Aphelenchoides fujianensis]|nr:hypothetical protein M3Y99_00416900 [Aphelenchoides fujianensis]
MAHSRFVVFVAVLFTPVLLAGADNPLLETHIGTFEGKRLEFEEAGLVDAFRGVPFARPPLGDLRFEKPEEAEFAPKRGAVEPKPACQQLDVRVFPLHEQSEDCFAQAGGSFQWGSARQHSSPFFVKTITTDGMVLINPRAVGFASNGEEAFAGNYGLWDLRAALLWVRRKAKALDVDPARITLACCSAGAAAVGMLTSSEQTRDLFQQSIQMSGSPLAEWATSEKSIGLTARVAAHLGCGEQSAADVKACLKEKSVEELLAAVEVLISDLLVVVPQLREAREKRRSGWPVFLSKHTHFMPPVDFSTGRQPVDAPQQTTHGYEYGVLFETRSSPPNRTADDLRFQRHLLEMFASFVKNGTPHSQFEAVSAERPLVYAEISTAVRLRDGLFGEELRFFDRLLDEFDFDLVRGAHTMTRRSRTEL